jgi:hypothetical protein
MMVRNCRFAENNVDSVLGLKSDRSSSSLNFIDWGKAELTLERCQFVDNEASYVGVIVRANQAKVIVNGSTFVGHRTSVDTALEHFYIIGINSTVLVHGSNFIGNAVSALTVEGPGATVIVQRTSFLGNIGLLGAGIKLGENPNKKKNIAGNVLEVSHSLFERNTAQSSGAAVYVFKSEGTQITLRNCTLRDNHAQS